VAKSHAAAVCEYAGSERFRTAQAGEVDGVTRVTRG
jgi:hypothetical protein